MRRTVLAIGLVLLAVAALAVWTTCAGPDPRGADVGRDTPRAAMSGHVDPPASRTSSVAPGPAPHAARPRARGAKPTPSAAAAEAEAGEAPDLVDLRVRVLRADGSPAAAASVAWRVPIVSEQGTEIVFEHESLSSRSGRAETDSSGRAVVRAVLRAKLSLDAHLGDEFAREDFQVESAAVEREIRLTAGLVVDGAVRTLDGAPAVGATVLVTVGPGGGLGEEQAIAADDGRFRAGPFPPGAAAAEVAVVAERDDLLPARIVVAPGESTRGVVVSLRPAVALRGRVVDEKGAPVKLTWLLFHDGDYGDEQRILSDENGRFTARMLPTARGDMIFVVHEYVARRIQEALRVPGVRDMGDVVVARGGTIRGTVVRPDGTPAERPHVGVISLDLGVAICEARMGQGATFEGWRVGPGEHVLHVRDLAPPDVGGNWDPVEVRGCYAGREGLRVVVPDGPGVLVRLHAAGDAADAAPRMFRDVAMRASSAGDDRASALGSAWKSGVHSIRVPGRPGVAIDIEVTAHGCEPWRAPAVRVPETGTAAVIDAFLVAQTPDAAPTPK